MFRRVNRGRASLTVIGGSSHPELTQLVARKCGVKPAKMKLNKFSNNETQVHLEDNVRGQHVYIIQTGGVRSNDAIVELLLIINSCKLASAATVTVITPFYPYSKSDQKSTLRSPITSKLIANMLQRSGADHIMMLEPHSPQLVGFFDKPVDGLKVESLFCTWIKNNIPQWQECIVVAPDEGGAKRSVWIANQLELDFAMIHNRHKKTIYNRKLSNKSFPEVNSDESCEDEIVQIEGVEKSEYLRLSHDMVDRFLKISGQVADRDCIVVDDMVDTGSTIRLALEVLQSHGARNVYVFATHGLFSGDSVKILQGCSNLKKIVVTNSLPQGQNVDRFSGRLDVVDISGMISEFIRRCHYRESVSVLDDISRELEHREIVKSSSGVENPSNNLPEEFDDNVVIAERPDAADHHNRIRRGFRLESVCWDN